LPSAWCTTHRACVAAKRRAGPRLGPRARRGSSGAVAHDEPLVADLHRADHRLRAHVHLRVRSSPRPSP
jgi:hypothetical protein